MSSIQIQIGVYGIYSHVQYTCILHEVLFQTDMCWALRNIPMQYSAIFHGCKNENFQMRQKFC